MAIEHQVGFAKATAKLQNGEVVKVETVLVKLHFCNTF